MPRRAWRNANHVGAGNGDEPKVIAAPVGIPRRYAAGVIERKFDSGVHVD